MPWPSASECERWVDWSFYQNGGPPLYSPFDVDAFCAKHPEVDGAVIRAIWPDGTPDRHYRVYYDGFRRNGKKVAAYLWPNPTKGVPAVLEDWKRALGDRVPVLIADDWEEAKTFRGKTRQQLTMHMALLWEARHKAFPNRKHISYSRASWLDAWITPGDWFRSIEWWLAHWIYPPPDNRDQAKHWEEIDRILPIHNNGTPFRGWYVKIAVDKVVGWQISSEGAIVPRGTSDMNYFLKSFLRPLYGPDYPPQPPKPSQPPDTVPVVVEVPKGKATVTVREV